MPVINLSLKTLAIVEGLPKLALGEWGMEIILAGDFAGKAATASAKINCRPQ